MFLKIKRVFREIWINVAYSKNSFQRKSFFRNFNFQTLIKIIEALSNGQALIRFFTLYQIKPYALALVRASVNSFEFHSYKRTP